MNELERGHLKQSKKVMKSVDHNTDNRSQITYNPYKLGDYKKISGNVAKEMSRGLGANIGDNKWTEEQEKLQRKNKFAEQLRQNNKKFGLMNAD